MNQRIESLVKPHDMPARCILLLVTVLVALGASTTRAADSSNPAPAVKTTFPRLLGMNIGAKNYEDPEYQRQLAKLDVVVLGFYKGWRHGYGFDQVVRNLKQLSNGKIIVGQYTILNECVDNPKNAANREAQEKLHEMNWWARRADGSRVQWTPQYNAWDINITQWAKPDAAGLRYPQWLAEFDDRILFKVAPFDLWYCDNVFGKPRVTADWDGDGRDDSPKDSAPAAAYRAGHRAEWDHIRKIHPGIPLMGNVDSDLAEAEYKGQLEGAFLEGLMGKSWSIETRLGWPAAMQRYHAAMANTRAPHLVGFNVHAGTQDFRFFRYAFTSCLLDDGYFCFSAADKGYSAVPWFDEYAFNLGTAVSKPPTTEWKKGVWRRDFQNGSVLVNPTKVPVTVGLEPGLARLRGSQAPEVNDGTPARTLTLQPKDGIVLRRSDRRLQS